MPPHLREQIFNARLLQELFEYLILLLFLSPIFKIRKSVRTGVNSRVIFQELESINIDVIISELNGLAEECPYS